MWGVNVRGGWMMVKHCHVANMAGLTPEGVVEVAISRESNRCWTQTVMEDLS